VAILLYKKFNKLYIIHITTIIFDCDKMDFFIPLNLTIGISKDKNSTKYLSLIQKKCYNKDNKTRN